MTQKTQLRVTTDWAYLNIVSEVDVVMTYRGYAPYVCVVERGDSEEKLLYISAKTLSEQLEPLRTQNAGRFSGIHFSVRKASNDRFAVYEVRSEADVTRDVNLLRVSREEA